MTWLALAIIAAALALIAYRVLVLSLASAFRDDERQYPQPLNSET